MYPNADLFFWLMKLKFTPDEIRKTARFFLMMSSCLIPDSESTQGLYAEQSLKAQISGFTGRCVADCWWDAEI